MTAPPLRLLLGIPLPEAFRQAVAACQQELTAQVRDFRPESVESLHVSLVAFPPLDPLMLPNVMAWCQLALKEVKSIDFQEGMLAGAPAGPLPRMVWLRFGQHPEYLLWYRRLNRAFQEVVPEHRMRTLTSPHVTLGRFPAQPVRLPDWEGPDRLEVREIRLWQFAGAEGIPLYTWPVAGR